MTRSKEELLAMSRERLIDHFMFIEAQTERVNEANHRQYMANGLLNKGLMELLDKTMRHSLHCADNEEAHEIYELTKRIIQGDNAP